MIVKKIDRQHKLIVTIVKKGAAKKVVSASKRAGAEGGTILLGRGKGVHENKTFLGIPVIPEKEIILTLVKNDIVEQVSDAIISGANFDHAGTGLGMIINTKSVMGICHLPGVGESPTDGMEGDNMEKKSLQYDLIVTVVNKGDAEKVVDSSKDGGAEGGTIINGRGTGIHEQAKFLNIMIEPEKEVVLTLVEKNMTKDVLESIEKGAKLNEPGKGIAFVLEVEKTIGINHILNKMVNEHLDN
ncbi:P-II family nitrogen regulator [Evansella tamaricis]|uniref:P-II family nitrogen regulator n=1 Tax=Evansella tamaricis TaxID=2069301 RepID=A0ABS6JEC3_9BACI|nr:P-II family nitrogen regulator [Evansella tamaricis]MBU9711996.1 P-II family nitrogen regulator [Evansella tamaricis]